MSKNRRKLTKSASRKVFRAGATRTEPKNISPRPMRGGIRL